MSRAPRGGSRSVARSVLLAALLCAPLTGCATSHPLLEAAQQADRHGEWIRAESLYRKVLEQQPDQLQARQRLGAILAAQARDLWLEEGRSEEPRARLAEARQFDPSCLPAQLLTLELDREEEVITLQQSVAELQRLVVAWPDSPDVRLALGAALLELGEMAAAVEQLHQGSRLAPADLRHPVMLADALRRANPEEARVRLERLLALHPESVAVQCGLARSFSEQGKFDEAQAVLERAAQRTPASPEIQAALRRLERQRREWNVDLSETGR